MLERLDELTTRVRAVEDLLTKDRFESDMDRAAEAGVQAAVDPGIDLD